MKASPSDQHKLLELQQLDSAITRAKRSIANPPQAEEIKQLDDRLVELDRAVLDKLGAVDDLAASITRIADDTRLVDERRARDQQRLEQGADTKTMQALQQEIQALDRRSSELDDQQLELMEQQETAEAELTAARDTAEGVRARRDKLAAERDLELESLRAELDRRESEREALTVTLPGDLLKLYDKQRERYGFGATLLQGRVSVAGGVELTASELAEVSRAAADDVVMCPASSAILVRTTESGL